MEKENKPARNANSIASAGGKYTFHVNGMHCNACVLMTESELKELPYITYVKSSLKDNSVEIVGSFGDKKLFRLSNRYSNSFIIHHIIYNLTKSRTRKYN